MSPTREKAEGKRENSRISSETNASPLSLFPFPLSVTLFQQPVSAWSLGFVASLKREVDRHRHHDRHWLPVQQRRRELPLLDGLQRGVVEHWDGAQHARTADGAIAFDARFEDDDALHLGVLRLRRIGGVH